MQRCADMPTCRLLGRSFEGGSSPWSHLIYAHAMHALARQPSPRLIQSAQPHSNGLLPRSPNYTMLLLHGDGRNPTPSPFTVRESRE